MYLMYSSLLFQAGFSPLHVAVLQMTPDMVSFLLRLEVDPNVRDHQGRTPLHLIIEGPFNDTGSNQCKLILPHMWNSNCASIFSEKDMTMRVPYTGCCINKRTHKYRGQYGQVKGFFWQPPALRLLKCYHDAFCVNLHAIASKIVFFGTFLTQGCAIFVWNVPKLMIYEEKQRYIQSSYPLATLYRTAKIRKAKTYLECF